MMTNPTLELVLEVARKIEPEKEWKISCGSVGFLQRLPTTDIETGAPYTVNHWNKFEPHLNTERGKSQLMDLVFRLTEDGFLFSLYSSEDVWTALSADHDESGVVHYGKTRQEAILKLANEVL